MGRNIPIACLSLIGCLLWGGALADFPQRDRGKLPYRPRWVTVLKKRGLFHYKRKEFSSPRILGDRVYVGSDAGFFYAISKKNGRKVWRFRTAGTVNGTAALGEDRLFFGDDKGFLYSVSLEKGQEIWRQNLGAEIHAEPTLNGGNVYVATLDGKVVALDGEKGGILWERTGRGPGQEMTIRGAGSPVIDQKSGRLFVGFADGTVLALRLRDGGVVWERMFPVGEGEGTFSDIDMKPIVEGGRLFFGTYDGKIICLSLARGTLLWSVPVGSGVLFATSGDRLYVSGSDGVLYALAKADGSQIWKTAIGSGALTAPVVYKGIVAVGLSDETVNFVDRETGRIRYRRWARKGIFSDPVIDEDKIYYLSNGGRLYSLRFVD